MSERPLSQRIQEGLVLGLVSEIKALERRLAEKLLVLDCLGWANCEKGEQVHCRFSTICQKVAEYQVRLAEANTLCIKLALQKGGQIDEIRELKTRLRAASELAKKWRGYKIPSVSECEQWMTKVAYTCADELEAIVGEAEG